MLINLEKIKCRTTPEQLLVLSHYYSIVKNYYYLNDLETINKAAKIAEFDQGVFDLFEMFAKDESYDFRNDLLLDFRLAVMDYEGLLYNNVNIIKEN
jgi:hypothetical protein